MSAWPQWDAKVIWPTGIGVALDRVTNRGAYYGPLGEPGTPDPGAAQGAWPAAFAGWTQPDGKVTYYLPVGGWEEILQAAVDAPLGLVNDEAMALWFQSEGVDPAANNPCATMARGFGEVFHPPWSMPFYPSVIAGQAAWVDSVTRGSGNFVPHADVIVDALRAQVGLRGIYDAIHQSSWCPGCPNYPSALYAQLQSAGAAPPSSGGGTNEPPPPDSTPVPSPTSTDTAPPDDLLAGWNQVQVVVTETLPVATGMLQTIANTKIGGV